MTRIGMIGMGLMGSKHCQAILGAATRFKELRSDPPRLVVCMDDSTDQMERAKALYGFERGTTSWQEVIAAEDVDLVMICSPNATHARFAQEASEAGKNVFCEKPVGRSPEETRRVADSASRNAVRSMVGYVYRWAPMTRYAQQLVTEGAIVTSPIIGAVSWWDTAGIRLRPSPGGSIGKRRASGRWGI